jgi:hypothetical protein
MLILAFSLWFVLLAAAAILAMWLVATARDSSRLGLMRRHQRKSLAVEEARPAELQAMMFARKAQPQTVRNGLSTGPGTGGRELPRSSERE